MAGRLGLGHQYMIGYIPSLRKSNEQFINHDLGGNMLVVETCLAGSFEINCWDTVMICVGGGQYSEVPAGIRS